MIRISQIKLNIPHTIDDLKKKAAARLNIKPGDFMNFRISRRSLDARDKSFIHYVYSVDVAVSNESTVVRKHKNDKNIRIIDDQGYRLPHEGTEPLTIRPVVVGAGPAGLFCAYMLAANGFRPLLAEQGQDVDTRSTTVEAFWEGRAELDPFSNIQFGEGGAGTFSDGKLVSGVKDTFCRKSLVMEIFHRHGAPESVLYDAKPHIGTDVLRNVIRDMREYMTDLGAEVCFNTKLTDIHISQGRLTAAVLTDVRSGAQRTVKCSDLILAAGHSARDTFRMLHDIGVKMISKPFAVGIRAQHLQEDINKAQYGKEYRELYGDLPPADYKLTARTFDGRSVYSFCMCPGGYVVNSSSEPGMLCINGMSYSKRESSNANSAIVVSINPEDIGAADDPMAAIEFQRRLEENAFRLGHGNIPVQLLGDFNEGRLSDHFGRVKPVAKGTYSFADLNSILPQFVSEDIKEAFPGFARFIEGYDSPDTVLAAVESRTSSPVRIIRDEQCESSIKGLYPCGEGAGYAGGITSAAIDGIRVFESLFRKYTVKR